MDNKKGMPNEKKGPCGGFDQATIEKLYKGGLIKEGTYQKIKKYSEGAIVDSAPAKEQIIVDPIQAQNPVASPTAFNAFEPISVATYAPNPTQVRLDQIRKDLELGSPGVSPEQREAAAIAQVQEEKARETSGKTAQAEAAAQQQATMQSNQQGLQSLGLAPAPGMNAAGGPPPAAPGEAQVNLVKSQPSQVPQQPKFDDSSFKQYEQGIAESAAAGAKQAAAMSSFQSEVQKTQMQQQQDMQNKMQFERTALDQQQQKVDQAAQEVASRAAINPNQFWQSKSTGQKIALGLSLAFGAAGGSNVGLQLMQQAINNDIDSQKMNSVRANEKLGAQRGIFGDMMARFGNEAQATAAARLSSWNAIEMKLKAQTAQTSSIQAKAEAMKSLAEVGLMKEKARNEFADATRKTSSYIMGSEMAQKIGNLPKEVQADAWKELGAYEDTKSGIQRIGQIMDKQFDASTLGSRILSPQKSSVDRATAIAELTPIARQISGGVLSDSETTKIIEPYMAKWYNASSDTAKNAAKESMISALLGMAPGKMATLKAFNILPPMTFNERAPVNGKKGK